MGMEVHNVNSKVVLLGCNEFESGTISVAANTTIPAGALLKRSGDGGFALAAVGDTAIAVMPFPLENKTNAAAAIGFRALISGKARADMLNIGGVVTTSAQNDGLRDYGIIPVKVTDMSRQDNQ